MTNLPSPARSTCRRVFAASSIFAVAATPFTLAVPAHAAGANVIEVYVSDLHRDTSIKDASVTLINATTGVEVRSTQMTNADGEVEFTGLDDGKYTAKVAASALHHERYSTVVEVRDDNDIWVEIEAAPKKAQFGRVSGSVTQNNDSVWANVHIFKADATLSSILSGDTMPVQSADLWQSDGTGSPVATWRSGEIPVGTYKILVGDKNSTGTWLTHPNEWWNGWSLRDTSLWVGSDISTATSLATSFAQASTFTVTEEGTTTFPRVQLPDPPAPAAPQVTGTVTDAAGKPISDIKVSLLHPYSYSEEERWYEETVAYTNAQGVYTIGGTFTGRHTLRFSDPYRGDYKPEFHGDLPADDVWDTPENPADEHVITLTTSGTVTANASLAAEQIDLSTGIYGTITDDLNRPNGDMRVGVFDLHGNRVDSLHTHRDGRWELASTRLAPGKYKVEAYSYYDDVLVRNWYGGKSYESAATITVPLTGSVNVGASKNQRFAEIASAVTVPAVDRMDNSWTAVTLYDSRGKRVDDRGGESGERTTFRVAPGTYYLGAEGGRWNSYTNATRNGVSFIDQFWKGSSTLRNATPIKLTSGATVTLNFTLGRTLAPLARPAITGKAAVGSVLRASTGTWNVEDNVAFSYTWKRGNTTVSTASTYKVTNADRGQRLTLTVKATDTTAAFAAGSSTVALNVPKLTAAEIKVNQAQAKVNATQAQLAKAKKALSKAKKAKKKAAVKKAQKKVAQLNKQLKTDKAALSAAQKAAK